MENKNYLFDNYINIARNSKIDGDNLKALKFYKKAYSLPIGKGDIDLLLDMALLYDELGFKDLAEKKYKEVIDIDKGEASAYYGLGVLYDEDKEYEKAKLLFNEDGTYTDRARKIVAGTPMGRFGNPEELIGAALFLASDDAAGFVNGIVLPVDGGYSVYSGV